jgi:predicted permease
MIVSAAAATASAVLFGLMPALRASRAELTAVMKGTDAIAAGPRGWGRAALVAGQIAGSVVLLAIAGFFTNDFRARLSAGPGFALDHRLVMWFDPALIGYDRVKTDRFYDDLADEIRRAPAVRSATVASAIPIDGGARPMAIAPEGFDFPGGRTEATVLSGSVDDHYFSTLQIPIVEGRAFVVSDSATSPLAAVVNAEVAGRYWPGQSPIGKRFRLVRERQFATVVGVAQTITYSFLLESPQDVVYFANRQRPQSQRALIVETVGDAAAMTAPVRELVRRLDPKQPIYNLRTLAEVYSMRVESILRIIIRLALAMSVIGLLLALVGLYGLVSYAVRRRTREIGIRIAIGAGQRDVLAMVLREGAVLAVIGLSAGLVVSAGAARLVTANFRVGRDGLQIAAPTVFAIIAGAVLLVTLISAYLPARRAARINPTEALRSE